MWKLTSWAFRKCGSFWDLEFLSHSYWLSKSGENWQRQVLQLANERVLIWAVSIWPPISVIVKQQAGLMKMIQLMILTQLVVFPRRIVGPAPCSRKHLFSQPKVSVDWALVSYHPVHFLRCHRSQVTSVLLAFGLCFCPVPSFYVTLLSMIKFWEIVSLCLLHVFHSLHPTILFSGVYFKLNDKRPNSKKFSCYQAWLVAGSHWFTFEFSEEPLCQTRTTLCIQLKSLG